MGTVIVADMRPCKRCRKVLPFNTNHFVADKKVKCGLRSVCRNCQNASMNRHRLVHGRRKVGEVTGLLKQINDTWTYKGPTSYASDEPYWTPAAINCALSDRDCANCPLIRGLESVNGNTCSMPGAVQYLIDSSSPIAARVQTDYEKQFGRVE